MILEAEYKIWSFSLCNFLRPPVMSHILHLDPNILLITLFSNTLNLCFSLNVMDQVLNPYKARNTIIVLLRLRGLALSQVHGQDVSRYAASCERQQ
jgi:hypothetical protein